jgi:hypothetical protein
MIDFLRGFSLGKKSKGGGILILLSKSKEDRLSSSETASKHN